MKKIIFGFFFILGVMFFILILISVYFYVADPLNLKPLFMSNSSDQTSIIDEDRQSTEVTNELREDGGKLDMSIDKNPFLNSAQEQALEAMRIDPANVPTSISAEQEACFVGIIGEARVSEIKAGAVPTAIEIFRARECLN